MRIDLTSDKRWFVFAFALVALVYLAFQARFIILGPKIEITNIENGAVVHEKLLALEGRAENVSWIKLNGQQIFTDEEGVWNEKLIVAEGRSIMTVEARDRFNRETKETVEVFYKP